MGKNPGYYTTRTLTSTTKIHRQQTQLPHKFHVERRKVRWWLDVVLVDVSNVLSEARKPSHIAHINQVMYKIISVSRFLWVLKVFIILWM